MFSRFRTAKRLRRSRCAPALAPVCAAVIESLEQRQMLHGDHHFALKVNFQHPLSSTPSGYVMDIGSKWGVRNGHTYGWNVLAGDGTRDRNDKRSPDQRYDTLNHFRSDYVWNLAVPNGTYSVTLVAGDPTAYDSIYKLNVENVLTVSGTPTSTTRWFTGTKTVTVSDGKLTVTNAAGAKNNKICFIEVTHADSTTPPPPTTAPAAPGGLDVRAMSSTELTLSWIDNASNESGFKIERRTGTSGTFSQVATVGANVTSFTDTGRSPSTLYGYRVRAYNSAGNSAYSSIDSATTAASTSTSSPVFSWSTAASLPLARQEGASAVVNGKLYVLGGFYTTTLLTTARVDIYNPATNSWARGVDMPERVTHAGQAVDGSTIYLAGGFVGDRHGPSTDNVWKFDTATGKWSKGIDLPAPRAGGALVKLGRELHYFGGVGAGNLLTGVDQTTHWSLNLDDATPRWTSVGAAFPNPRNHLAGVAANGRIYAIGGQKGNGEASANQSSVHVYNPTTRAWSSVASLPRPTGHIGANTVVLNGRIIVLGGVTNGPTSLSNVVSYDPATNVWVALKSLPAARSAAMAGVIDGNIIFSGGENGGARSQSNTWTATFANKWETAAPLPASLAEVAGGIIGNKMYVVGEVNSSTYAYNLSTGAWSTLRARPYVGDHHAAEVINGKLYLFGGLAGGDNKVQIYNPATNSWSLGADIPFKTGSAATALINGQVYLAGGITNFVPNVGGTTTNKAARYNPSTNAWMMLPNMPQGVNHAASATNGKKFYIFGGRAGVGVVENGFTTVQSYDPATNTWKSSLTGAYKPLPQARGGMGKAVFHNGEFYIMGGETKDGAGATSNKVYNRVDIYKLSADSWRVGPPMPTARHGIFPLLHAGRIYVAAGGTKAGAAMSSILEIFNPI